MRQGEGNAISINGGRPEATTIPWTASHHGHALETPAVILSQDAIQEFKVQSGIYSAEYGFRPTRSTWSARVARTSSRHHLRVQPQRRIRCLAVPDSNQLPQSAYKRESSTLRLNQFGFVAGGPVYIPETLRRA